MAKPPLERSYQCTDSNDQRVLTGTWCIPELEKAVDLGYEIQYIYEVWHFPQVQEGLFRDYVNTWFKIKQEASGWPDWVGDDETKRQQYIHDYYQNEGLRQDRAQSGSASFGQNDAQLHVGQVRAASEQNAGQRIRRPPKISVSSTQTPSMCVTSLLSMMISWKFTISIRKKTSRCHPTSKFSWPVSPPVGRVSVSTKLSNSWANACCILTLTLSSISRNRDSPTLLWETTSVSSPMN